jgi:hypothetical protein
MTINKVQVHPSYAALLEDWQQLTDTYSGERVVKSKGTVYLPATSGMLAGGMENANQAGAREYDAYKKRAVFHDLVRQAVEGMVGILHREPPNIELPEKLEPLRDNATVNGESLDTLLRRINEAQFLHGRYALLLEPDSGADVNGLPYIAPYEATSVINWDDGIRQQGKQKLEMVVLDESAYVRTEDFTWEVKYKYRVLVLNSERNNLPLDLPAQGTYLAGVQDDALNSLSSINYIEPQIGGVSLNEIPFVFINTNDLVPEPDLPPLLGLSNLALAIYRGEADYRQTLFMQGQDTLVVIGDESEEELAVGANAMIKLPAGGDAKYIGVNSNGLKEMKEAIANDKLQASEQGARLMDFGENNRQSGEALKIRVAAKTASLTSIAQTGAEGLQRILRKAAEWVGADPEQVIVTPNLKFADEELTGKQAMEWMQAKVMGAPISSRSIHRLMQERGVTEYDYEEELDEIDSEGAGLETQNDLPVDDENLQR